MSSKRCKCFRYVHNNEEFVGVIGYLSVTGDPIGDTEKL